MDVLDLKKRYSALYKPKAGEPVVVDVPPLRFLMLDGEGDIGGQCYGESVAALYRLAYSTKFEAKKRLDLSYPVMPLQGLFWAPAEPESRVTPASHPTPASLHALAWRLMLLLPDEVPGEFVDEVREKVAAKRTVPRLAEVRVQTFSEGGAVQVLHIGPYAEETRSIDRLLAFARQRGLEIAGRHHEIYLNDPQRTAAEKLKTVIRYPVRRARA